MAEQNDNIPTLTQVVERGDESMRHHFDSQGLEHPEEKLEITLENASEFENSQAPQDIPSITLEVNEDTALPNDDFSDAMQERLDEIENEAPVLSSASTSASNSDDLKQQIDQAIEQALPGIEALLKEKLYRKFNL